MTNGSHDMWIKRQNSQMLTLSKPSKNIWTSITILTFMTWVILGPIITNEYDSGQMSGQGNAFRQITYTITFVLSLIIARIDKYPLKMLNLPITIILVIFWCLISITWSIDPSVSIRRLFLTIIVIWTIFILVDQVGFDKFVDIFQVFLLILLLINYIAVFTLPTWSIHQAGEVDDPGLIGNWRGVLPQKNFTGAICAITVMVFQTNGQRIKPLIRLIIITFAIFYLYKTHSKTSLDLLIISLFFSNLYILYNTSYRAFVLPIFAIVSVLIYFYSVNYWPDLLEKINRPDSFTGRGQIWPALINYSRDHLFTGAGYGSFWNVGVYSPIYQYARGWITGITSGHDGYLDFMVQVGLPGLCLAVIALFIVPIAHIINSTKISKAHGALVLSITIFCAGHNLTESSIMERDDITQVCLMIAIALGQVGRRNQEKTIV